MTKSKKSEWSLFLNDRNRICYNELCRRCVGLPILCVATAFIVYALGWGLPNPDIVRRLETLISQLFYSTTAGILSTAITGDVGWTGIIVAWLSQLNTIVIFVVSALVCMLHYGSTVAAATFSQVDSSFANMLQGVILFLVLAADFYTRFRVVMDQKGGNGNGNG